MIVLEMKAVVKPSQCSAIDEAIRTVQFIRNKALRLWMDAKREDKIDKYSLNKYCAVLAKQFKFADDLNSTARQASAERAWSAIARFYDNCKKGIKGKKGYPKFQKNNRSVEYKHSGGQLSEDRKKITFTDKKNIGTVKLKGTRDLNFYPLDQIKRVRIVKRADGYYVQFCINLLNRKKSKKFRKGQPQSNNYQKARKRYARKHLRVSRQRKGFAQKEALRVIKSNDFIAQVDLNVKGMVKNSKLAKSISDVAWSTFRQWLEYFGFKYGKSTVAVAPHNTSQNCSNCDQKVPKSLSTRTHICPHCGYVEDRDINAAINILKKGLSTVGHTGTHAWGEIPSGLVGYVLPD